MHYTLAPPALLPTQSSLQSPNERESVYNLIPKHQLAKQKQERYVSQHAPEVRKEYKQGWREAGTLGKEKKQSSKEDFVKRGEGEKRRAQEAQQNAAHHVREAARKAPTPKKTEQITIKHAPSPNFVKENVDEIKGAVPEPEPAPKVYIAKPDYGKVPAYLQVRKEELDHQAQEYMRMVESEQRRQQAASGLILLPEEERLRVLSGLQSNLDALNREYGKLSLTVDTLPKITRKLNIEAQLEKLEGAVEKFSHTNIYVKTN